MIIRIEATINITDGYVSQEGEFVQTSKGTEVNLTKLRSFLIHHADTVSITYENNLEPFFEEGERP